MGRNKWKGRKVGRRSKRMEGRKIERKEAEGGRKLTKSRKKGREEQRKPSKEGNQ